MKHTMTAMLATILLSTTLSTAIDAEALFIPSRSPGDINAGNPDSGIVFVQASENTLSDSDMLRVLYYCDRAILALDRVANSNSRTTTEIGHDIDALRESLIRLVEAGQRSGIPQAETVAFFRQYVLAESPQSIPVTLLDGSGDFDASALFSSVSQHLRKPPAETANIDSIIAQDLASVRLVAIETRGAAEDVLAVQDPVETEQVVPVNPGPNIPENATADVRSILERVIVQDDEWLIEVTRQDTLAQYADALYGNRQFFMRIYNENRDQLFNPDILTIGALLKLPK